MSLKGQPSSFASKIPWQYLHGNKRRTEMKRQMREEALLRQDFKCIYCLRELYALDATLDHFRPKATGGKLRDNVVAACFACNHNKADKDGEEVLRLVEADQIPPRGTGKVRSIWRRRRQYMPKRAAPEFHTQETP